MLIKYTGDENVRNLTDVNNRAGGGAFPIFHKLKHGTLGKKLASLWLTFLLCISKITACKSLADYKD